MIVRSVKRWGRLPCSENLPGRRGLCCHDRHGANESDMAAVFALRAGHCVVGAVLGNCAAVVIGGLHVAGACGIGAGEPAEDVADDDMRVAAVVAFGDEVFCNGCQSKRIRFG